MRLALGLVGLVLLAVAFAGWRLTTDAPAGDVAAAESLLTPTTALPLADAPSSIPPTSSTSLPPPLWEANEPSQLGSLDEGPAPTSLRIDKLDIDAPVGPYGVDEQGRMDVPDNITEVGWYRFGPSPGEGGSAVLAAHVDLAGPGRGLFYELDDLEEGDEVEVSFDDGSSLRFEVVAQTTYLKDELPLDLIFSREGEPVLTLVTCGGAFSRSARSYDSNVVVYAVPVG